MIDCHSHLAFMSDDIIADLISSASEISFWVQGGYDPKDWRKQQKLKEKYPNRIRSCFGLHPWYVRSDKFNKERDLEQFKMMMDHADCLGEMGLDFVGSNDEVKKERQLDVFEEQLKLASHKPVALHIVQAHGAALELLKDYKPKAFVHSFSGSYEVARDYVDMGIMISFGPQILNPNFKKARNSLKKLSLDSILIESDSPASSQDPEYDKKKFQQLASEVAKIKGIELKDLFLKVEENWNRLQES